MGSEKGKEIENLSINVMLFRWLGIVMDVMGGLVVFFAAVFAIMQRDTISGGVAGLSISIAMQV